MSRPSKNHAPRKGKRRGPHQRIKGGPKDVKAKEVLESKVTGGNIKEAPGRKCKLNTQGS